MRAPSENGKRIAIIGAGVAGLCAGVYARRAGFEVDIYEMADSSGGLATSWKRNDYTFEGCLHWLLGTNPSSPYHAMWNEVFDIDQLRLVEFDEFVRVEDERGNVLVVHRNVDTLEEELLASAPEDAEPIRRLAAGVRRLSTMDLPLASAGRVKYAMQLLRAVPYLPELRFWTGISSEQFGTRFGNPLLRAFFGEGGTARISAVALVFSLAWMSRRDAAYPVGGSQAVIKLIEKRFLESGGRIHFGAQVERILVEQDAAAGIRLAGGGEIRADWVISAADGHATLFEWIPEAYRDPRALAPYAQLEPFPSYLQVSLGVHRDLADEPAFFTRVLDAPFMVDPLTQVKQLSFRVFNFDPSFAPPGRTPVTCFIPTANHEYWMGLQRSRGPEYAARKREIAEAVIDVLERRTPGIRVDIEVVDVSTPASVIRHTGNWRGSMEGFLITPKSGFRMLRNELPGLRRFLMVGQWVMPGGGLPSGLMTARQGIQRVCRSEGIAFRPGQAARG